MSSAFLDPVNILRIKLYVEEQLTVFSQAPTRINIDTDTGLRLVQLAMDNMSIVPTAQNLYNLNTVAINRLVELCVGGLRERALYQQQILSLNKAHNPDLPEYTGGNKRETSLSYSDYTLNGGGRRYHDSFLKRVLNVEKLSRPSPSDPVTRYNSHHCVSAGPVDCYTAVGDFRHG